MPADAAEIVRLAERVEQAAGPDRELDAAIILSLGHAVEHPTGDEWFYQPANKMGRKQVPAYTASLDAAMTLAPEGQESAVLHDAWRAVSNFHALHIRFWKRDADGDYGQALARQVAAAALRARAAQHDHEVG